jgi:EAL domain-containing protein (putative c-di-GMP-specific phosphodiesterase class I)
VSILQKTKLEPNRLHLEITENTIVEDVEQTLHTITKISSLGVELHLDDFGTGYSSIAYLHRFPVKALKIDKSFIARLEHQENGNGHALVRGIINLANTLNLDVIAEGIEYSEQFTFLKELNCGQGQGFYASKPVYKEDMELILAEQRKIFTPPKE